MKSGIVITLICCFVSGCGTLGSKVPPERTDFIEEPLKDKIIEEAMLGCNAIATALRIHYAVNGSFDGIQTPFDTTTMRPGDCNGTYFNDESYSLKSLDSGKYFVIEADGIGEATGVCFVYSMTNIRTGKSEWKITKHPTRPY